MENNNHQNMNSNGTNNLQAGEDELVDRYFMSLPPGYGFYPNDRELIENYLKKKVMNQELPINRIFDVDLYNEHPETLTGKYKKIRARDWYFFTQRARKYPNGHRPDRKAGEGYWKPTGTDVAIPEVNPQGYRKSLDYYEGKHPNGVKSDWKMHEFRLHDAAVDRAPSGTSNNGSGGDSKMLDGWVLCKVYKKNEKSRTGDVNGDAVPANSSHPSDTAANHQWEYRSPSFPRNENGVNVNGHVRGSSSHSACKIADLPSEFGNCFPIQNGAAGFSDPQQNYFHGSSSSAIPHTTWNNISNNYPHDGSVMYQPLNDGWGQTHGQVGCVGNKMGNHVSSDGLPSSSSNPLMHLPAPEGVGWLPELEDKSPCPEEEKEESQDHLSYFNSDISADEGEQMFKADD